MPSVAIQAFIEKHIDLIDKLDFESLYNLANIDEHVDCSALTELFMTIDIAPQLYMKRLPDNFIRDYDGVKSFVIPPNIEEIGTYAFAWCDQLQTVIFTTGELNEIKDRAFMYTNIESVILPDSVCEIGPQCFAYCGNLTYFELGKGISTLHGRILQGCLKLKEVHYRGTKEDWNLYVEAHDRWLSNTNVTKIKCSDGDIEL